MLNDIYHRKNSIVGIVIASVCILVYLGAVVSVIVRIHNSMERRALAAEKEFYDLADLASSAAVVSFMDETYMAAVQNALESSETLEAVIITGPNGEYSFERETGKAVSWINGSPRFRKRIDLSGQPLYQPLRIQELRNVNIQAVAGALDYAELGGVFKQALYLVAAALLLAIVTLVMGSKYFRKSGAAAVPVVRNRPAPVEEPVGTGDKSPSADTAGYSERSNVIREEYTETRLTAELRHSAAANQDLALVFVEFKPITDGKFYARFAADAARFFSSRDFVCEKGERGLSIICPGLNIDTAFLNADEFHNRIMGKYPGLFKAKTDLCMGISARSGRPINAAHLIFETEEALERAMMDPVSHIVAFRSDPERFRAFMESRTRETPS